MPVTAWLRHPRSPRSRRAKAVCLAVGVLALGVALRLGSWNVAFQPAGVFMLGDSDPNYHVLRAERLLRGDGAAAWRDPAMDWPFGAEILWPPLFDAIIAGVSRLAFGEAPTRDDVARTAAFVALALGLLTIPLVAALGRRLLGARRGWLAALFVALLPAHAGLTVLGRADQHGAELLLYTAILLLFARSLRHGGPSAMDGAALASVVAVAFWTWQGSALLLVVPAAFTVLWHALAPD